MSEFRQPEFSFQIQQRGQKVARVEVFAAHAWRERPRFRALYPVEAFERLYRLRVAGRWWWAEAVEGARYPFLTLDEAWYLISGVALGAAGLPGLNPTTPAPAWGCSKQRVVAMVQGYRCVTHVLDQPWRGDDGLWWGRIVAVKHPVPLNALVRV